MTSHRRGCSSPLASIACLVLVAVLCAGAAPAQSRDLVKTAGFSQVFITNELLENDTDTSDNCPGVVQLNETNGYFYSPGFPNNYPNNAECFYTVQGPENTKIEVRFYVFVTELCCDHVYIYEGGSPTKTTVPIAELSGNYSNGTFVHTNSSNIMTINFATDPANTDIGFYAEYVATSVIKTPAQSASTSCLLTNYENSFGVIVSPNFPAQYFNNADCGYLIGNGSIGTKIRLTTMYFQTEGCCDAVQIYNGTDSNGVLVGTLSGTPAVGNIIDIYGPYAFLLFTTDSYNTENGFSFTYQILEDGLEPSPPFLPPTFFNKTDIGDNATLTSSSPLPSTSPSSLLLPSTTTTTQLLTSSDVASTTPTIDSASSTSTSTDSTNSIINSSSTPDEESLTSTGAV